MWNRVRLEWMKLKVKVREFIVVTGKGRGFRQNDFGQND